MPFDYPKFSSVLISLRNESRKNVPSKNSNFRSEKFKIHLGEDPSYPASSLQKSSRRRRIETPMRECKSSIQWSANNSWRKIENTLSPFERRCILTARYKEGRVHEAGEFIRASSLSP